MINSIQKILYILGTISPYSMIASACYGGQVSVNRCKQWFVDMEVSERAINNEEILNCFITSAPFVSWLFIAISAILLVYHLCFLRIANKRLAPMDFFPEATPEENDDFAKGLGVTYFLPIIEWIITKGIYNVDERTNGYFLLEIGVIAVLISLVVNKSYGSPVYMLVGYHFHTVETEASKTYILMSKKKHFRNKNQVRRVVRLFEDFLIDVDTYVIMDL